jgi:hypothetical protein
MRSCRVARPGRLRRLGLVGVNGAALLTGMVVGVNVHSAAGSHTNADPCPCALPACRTVCYQN